MELTASSSSEKSANKPSEPLKIKPSDFLKIKQSDPLKIKPTDLLKIKPSDPLKIKPSDLLKIKPSDPLKIKPSGNRRKSGHHRIIEDDNISFETIVIDCAPTASTTTKSPPKAANSHSTAINQSSPKKRKIEPQINIEDHAATNQSLLEKVAFLRVSVNYLMLRLGLTPFDFSQKIELKDLMQAYNEKKKALVKTNRR